MASNIDHGSRRRQVLARGRNRVSRCFPVLALSGALAAAPLAAQAGRASGEGSPAGTYLERYREVVRLTPLGEQVADVHHLVLRRDAGQLTLERGKLYLLSPVGGRRVGAVFQGEGRFAFAPPVPAEQAELRRFAGSPSLDDTLTEAIIIFSDTTADQFRGLGFGQGDVPGDVADHVHDLINSLKGDNEGSFSSDVIGPLLNGEATGFFLARVARAHGDPVLFELNPDVSEAVQLYRPVSRVRWGASWAVVSQFPPERPPAGTAGFWHRERLSVPSYRIEIRLTSTFSANLDFAANGTLALKALEPVGPWLAFALHPTVVVDSARWSAGEPASVFKAKDSGDLWVRAGRRLQPGDSLALTLLYHSESGGLIDRYGNWFFIDPGAAWYPENGQGKNLAMFDLTFHSPSWYPLASVGDRTDSSVAGKVLTTHWVTRLPTPFASFNLGLFENYHVQHPGAPPLDVLLSEEAHLLLRRELAARGYVISQQSHMRENVAADVSNSLKLFTNLFGECPYGHFYVTEIPYSEGVSFPGMIDLSWGTFQNTSFDGFDEFFRAHEAAHQWWGNGVLPGSYRDRWLTEGLASFSALWYVQSARKHNDEYFRFLDQYKADIKDEKDDAGPIWIGYRNSTPSVRRGYDVVIYEKGAWVFHMLRILMLDLATMKQDRFTETMRDYYQSYRGKAATTADFQAVVERHAGIPMDWFFDEWVKGTGIPTYHVAWTSQPTGEGKYRVRLRVTQEHVPADFQMWVLVSADLGDNRFAHFRIGVRGDQTEYESPLLPVAPKDLKFNALNSVLADVKMERW
jgi:hypothetical protein